MELIGKKYRVLKSLGTGAMGEVFLVLPPRGEPVALKLLRNLEGGHSQAAIAQFENEFKVLKKLSHPNIGKIFEYGYDEEQKKVFFTSPWLKGSDLFVATADQPFEKVEDFFVQVLRAVNYLHQKGIIHCDLKPGNIFVENETIQLIDFGLAGYWGESIVGTPTYLAPEIYRGEHHNVTSDLYAVGVIFYVCLTRTQPFSGATLQEVYDRHRTYTPTPISDINPKVPKYFSDIVSSILAKKPEERYQNASSIIEDLAAYSQTKYSIETSETLLSYLPTTSELIGRKELQWRVGNLIRQFMTGRAPYYGLHIYGGRGLGKSKFIHQIKNELQLEKIPVEEVLFPLGENEKRVLAGSKALILEDVDALLSSPEGRQNVQDFLSFLEQRLLSPDTSRFLFLTTGSEVDSALPYFHLFPQDDLISEAVELTPLTEEETKSLLETIIGQKEIPPKFVSEIYRNTGGNPGILSQIIQKLIEQEILFDKSGRWSSDLLAHLGDALQKIEVPRSLEEQLLSEYTAMSAEEKEIVKYLALDPRGLTERSLEHLTRFKKIGRLLDDMVDRKLLREEKDRYYFYKTTFSPFVLRQLPVAEQKKGHTYLASSAIGLDPDSVLYHQSRGDDPLVVQSALEKLAVRMVAKGHKEAGFDSYQRLLKTFLTAPLLQRLPWSVKASEILVWLNRFAEAEEILTKIENDVKATTETIPLGLILSLFEKKGLALLHQEKIAEARRYFEKGYERATQSGRTTVEECRFLNDMAQIEMITGHPEKAISIFARARERMKGLPTNDLQQITNNDLGHVYYQLKDYDRAIDLLREDVGIFSEMTNHEPLVRAIYTMAECYRAQKKFKKAIKEYQICIRICQENNLLAILLRAYNGLGNIYLSEGDNEQALQTYQRAIEISVRLKDPTTKAALLANQGLIYRNEKNWPQASRCFMMAKQILEQKGMKLAYEHQLLSKCYDELTFIARESKDNLKALAFQLERAQVIEKAGVLTHESFDVRLNLAELYLENRLADSFMGEVQKLEGLAKSPVELQQILALKTKWQKIQNFDQETTMKV